jgi:DNA-binding MarR family transcriptional regulator
MTWPPAVKLAFMQPTPLDDDEAVTTWGLVVEGFTATTQRLRTDLDGELAIPLAWLDVLLRLLRTPGHRLGMSALAAHTAITTGGFTRMADRMTEAGLVRREPCGADRRVVWITLTPVGVDLAERARVAHARHLRARVLDVLDPAEIAALAGAMRRLRDHAWAEEAPPPTAASAADPCSAPIGPAEELRGAPAQV